MVEGISEETELLLEARHEGQAPEIDGDRKSTRLNSSHSQISYAVFCLKKKKTNEQSGRTASEMDPTLGLISSAAIAPITKSRQRFRRLGSPRCRLSRL